MSQMLLPSCLLPQVFRNRQLRQIAARTVDILASLGQAILRAGDLGAGICSQSYWPQIHTALVHQPRLMLPLPIKCFRYHPSHYSFIQH